MRTIIFLIMLCAGAYGACAQQYFNQRNTLHSFATQLRSVVESNGRYYCTGFGIDSVNDQGNGFSYNILGLKFCVFDAAGTKLCDTVWQKQNRQIISAPGTLRRLEDGSFIEAMDGTDTQGKTRQIIVCVDSMGRHLWDREYDNPFCNQDTNNFLRFVDIKPVNANGWLLFATFSCKTARHHDLLLTKLDSNFNVVWQKKYGSPTIDDGAGRLLIESDGYVLGCVETNINQTNQNYIYRAKMIKVDTAGNELWTWKSSTARKTDGINDLIRTRDGGYVYCGAGNGYEIPSSTPGADATIYFNGWVEKIDANRNTLWHWDSKDSFSYGSQFNTIRELPDGRLRAFGHRFSFTNTPPNGFEEHNKGWMLLLSANGDSLTQRLHAAVTSSWDKNYFNDAKPTADGGFIMVGESTDMSPSRIAPIQRGWLVKVDSNGCLGAGDPQCWPVGVPRIAAQQGEVKIYPNPASSELHIEYKGSGKAVFELTDITGRTLATALLNSTGTAAVDVSQLANGIYLYRVIEGGTTTAKGKVVKQQ